jgi:hypothetical protein
MFILDDLVLKALQTVYVNRQGNYKCHLSLVNNTLDVKRNCSAAWIVAKFTEYHPAIVFWFLTLKREYGE